MKTYADLLPEQLDAIEFIGEGEDSLLAADVGTGKTVIALTAAKYALATGKVKRWLVLAPLLVATDTWAQESYEWEHLSTKDVAIACGSEQARMDALVSDARIVVMNYENLAWLLEEFPRNRSGKAWVDLLPFDGLICDEVDKLKSVSSNRFKAIRNRIGKFNKRIGLTGTLVPNDMQELWGQVFMVDGGQSFGRSFYDWRRENFYPTDHNNYNWEPFDGAQAQMIEQISDLTYRIKAKGLPKVIELEPARLEMPSDTWDVYGELEREYFLEIRDIEGKVRSIDVANAAVLTGKLQQICAGFSYVDGEKDAVWHSKARFNWLDGLLARHPTEQMLVFYHFNEELDELQRRYPGLAHLGTGVTNGQKRKYIEQWNKGELDMLALHPASAGHGLNLQKSGAHDIAFLTLPWSGGLYKQVLGRLARRGNKAKHVMVHTCVFADTIDENVFAALSGKIKGMEGFLNDLETATRKAS